MNENEEIYDDELIEESENEPETEEITTQATEEKNPYIEVIMNYLESVMKFDTNFREVFVPGMEKECFNYIYENARKLKHGNCAMIEDNVVFKWARDFYNDGIALKELEEKKAKEQKESEKKAKAKADAERKKILDEFYSKSMTEKKNVNTDDFVQLELF